MRVFNRSLPGIVANPRITFLRFAAIQTHSPSKPALIFVSSRRQTRLTALDLIAHLAAENDPKQWLHMDETEVKIF